MTALLLVFFINAVILHCENLALSFVAWLDQTSCLEAERWFKLLLLCWCMEIWYVLMNTKLFLFPRAGNRIVLEQDSSY